MSKLLLVEDDAAILRSLVPYLEGSGHEVVTATDGLSAVDSFVALTPDLVILDLNLPELDGFHVCQQIRKVSTIPVIILSARSSEDDKIHALDLWADDYVAKPFSPRELVARVSAVLKRSAFILGISVHSAQQPGERIGNILIDREGMRVSVDGALVDLTKTEFAILLYILDRRGVVVERTKMMKDVIGYDHYLQDRTIDTHMKNLRRKLGDAFVVETVRGIGYRMEK